jgi:hypothetical protein
MKLLSFKHIFILGALLAAGSVQVHAADEVTGKSEELELTDSIVHDTLVLADGKLTRYDRRVMRYRKHWDLLIPTSGIIQTCGNMGIISLGIGWEYGKRRQWETQLLFGYIPKFSSDDEKLTMTLKENFIPWRRNIGKGWWFEPLECSLYFNTVFGHDFWTKQPTKYESGYYPLPESVLISPWVNVLSMIFRTINVSVSRVSRSSMSWVQQISTLCVSTVTAMPVSGMSSASLSVPRCSTFKPRTG